MGYRLTRPCNSAAALAAEIGLGYSGEDRAIVGVAPLDRSEAGFLSFCSAAASTAAEGAIVIADPEKSPVAGCVIASKTPRLDFIRALDLLERRHGFVLDETPPDIHPTVRLGQGCVIENGVTIGAHTRIGPNAVILRGSRIGEHCLIRATAVIGDEGFGFEREPDGRPLRFVHLGGVRIGNHVEIGNATMVCRGTLGDTIVEDYVKIDNLVHVAHNCHLEEGAMIIAGAEVSGAVRVGKNAWIGPNACVIQKVQLGEGSLVGIGAVVLKNVDAGAVVVGNPAKPLQKN
jgi:UDP-3-O-[3-hydroxymyristoyl] glucosamine N-acyltransferase